MIDRVKDLIAEELTIANCKFPLFNGKHEAFGVIAEEVLESKVEYEVIDYASTNKFV